MATDEEKKLCEISVSYIERLLEGHHPVDNSIIENDTILLDENVQRCFLFMRDILIKYANSSNEKSVESESKEQTNTIFSDNAQMIIEQMIRPREITATELEEIIKSNTKKLFKVEVDKITAVKVSNWLVEKGYLLKVEDKDGNRHREATETGKIIGITNNFVQSSYGRSYIQYRFTPKAQRFVFENLPEILIRKKKRR